MKNVLAILFGIQLLFSSCGNEKTAINNPASEWELKTDTQLYNTKTELLNAQVDMKELPNEFQRKKQVFSDSTLSISWSDAGFSNGNNMIRFYQQFYFLVKERNKEAISKLIKFPLSNIATKKEFIENFDAIFDETFCEELVNQNPNELFRNKEGCMAGKDGQIWFKPNGATFKITAINY